MSLSNNLQDINLADNTITPTIDIPALDGAGLDQSAFGPTTPVANVNQSGGFDINQVLSTLSNMFDSGVDVYNNVARTIGTKQIGPQAPQPAKVAAPVLGLSTTQWVIIGGGAAILLAIVLVRRA